MTKSSSIHMKYLTSGLRQCMLEALTWPLSVGPEKTLYVQLACSKSSAQFNAFQRGFLSGEQLLLKWAAIKRPLNHYQAIITNCSVSVSLSPPAKGHSGSPWKQWNLSYTGPPHYEGILSIQGTCTLTSNLRKPLASSPGPAF